MRSCTLLLAMICSVTAQMTFTDNWEKRGLLPDVLNEWQRNYIITNEQACSRNAIAQIAEELQHISRKQIELTELITKCIITKQPLFAKQR